MAGGSWRLPVGFFRPRIKDAEIHGVSLTGIFITKKRRMRAIGANIIKANFSSNALSPEWRRLSRVVKFRAIGTT